MPTGIDLKGAKQASGVAKRPKGTGENVKSVICGGGQIWDKRLGKCVKSVAPPSTLKKASKALGSAPIPNK